MRKAAYWISGIVGALVIAVALIVVFFQWSWLRGPIEARLSALTGKQVRIDGPITGDKAWVPHIVFSQVRIEAPGFQAQPHVGTIDRVEVAIDLHQLLRGRLDFPEIGVDKPILALLRNPDGTANWSIADEVSGPANRGRMPLIGTIKVENGKITYRDVAEHLTIDATLETAAANGGSARGNLTLQGHGTYRQAPFTIKLKGGSLDELRNTSHPYDLDAAASVGNTRMRVAGTVLDPFKLTDMNLKLVADGENAADLYPIFGIPAPATPPYHLEGTLDRDGKAWLFKNFSGTVGASDLAGSLRFEPARKRLFVGGKLTSKNLDFADLGLLVGAPGATEGNRPVSDVQRDLAHRMAATGRVLPDAPLNLDEVRNVDADVLFHGEHVVSKTLPLENVDLHLKLDNALMSLTPLNVGIAGGRIESNVIIDARQNAVSTDYDVRFHHFQADQFFKKANVGTGASGTIDGRIRLHGTGDSVRKSLATSNGEASAMVEQGRISVLLSDLLGLDVVKALGVYITGDKQITMRCMVADFTVQNGTMTPRAFVLDTDDTLINGTGTISLQDERLDLSISGKSKSPTLTLGGPIKVSGTFRKPDVGLGAEAVVRGGASVALGALLTPLAAILGVIGGTADDADCAQLVKEANADTSVTPPGTKHVPAPSPAKPARKRK
jgi:uncharacterized protein involved in outer membrane biogenesis